MKSTEEKKDLVEKEFIGFLDIAADTINALLYQGRLFTDAGNLRAGPTETAYETFHQEKKKFRSQFEDLCRYELQDGHIKIMYLIANQSKADGRMLLRKDGLQAALTESSMRERHRMSIRSSNSYFTGESPGGGAAGSCSSCSEKRSIKGHFRKKHGNISII